MRVLISDCWLSVEEVDKFKDEVKASWVIAQAYTITNALQSGKKKADDNDADHWEDIPDAESGSLNCVDRWRNAGPEEQK